MAAMLDHPADARQLHPRETAGRLAANRIPLALMSEPARVIQQRLQSTDYETVELIVVTDESGLYQGVVEIKALLAAAGETPASALVATAWPVVRPGTDQEHAAAAASHAQVAALPVVGADGRPVGVLSPVVLLEVMAAEHREDVNRLVGILREQRGARHALEDPPLHRLRSRLPWLIIGLILSSPATALMAGFEHALESNVTIAFFIPALVYLTDAIGTQTEAIAVRGLSLRHKPLATILLMEVITGGLIGLVLGLIALVGVSVVFGDPRLAVGVGSSLFVAGTIASAVGLLFPWLLSRFGIDPAFGSGPVATIVQDVLTILVYFLIMTALMPGVAA